MTDHRSVGIHLDSLAAIRNDNALDAFEVIPGESLHESLSRAIDYHVNGHTFSEILRMVKIKRLELDIAQMRLTEPQRERINRLFELSKPARMPLARVISHGLQRRAIKHNLTALGLSECQLKVVADYEHVLVTGSPPAPSAVCTR